MYVVIFVFLVAFLYLSKFGKRVLESGGGLVGVLMGTSMTFGLCVLAITLGYGLVKIPIKVFKASSIKKRYDYAVYKVAHHHEKIMELLHTKKHSISTMLYILDRVEIESEDLQVHVDEMLHMVNNVLERTNEERLKNKMISSRDIDTKLLERFNNG